MANDLKLRLVLNVVDQALGPLKRIADGSGALSGKLKATREELRKLEGENRGIERFRTASRDLAVNNNALKTAQAKVRELAQAMKATDQPTKVMQREFAKAVGEAGRLKDRSQNLAAQQERLRRELVATGVPLKGMAQHQADLRNRMQLVTKSVKAQTEALEEQANRMKALDALKARHGKQMLHVGMMAGAGAASIAAGRAAARPVLATMDAFRQQEDAASQLRASMMQAGGVVPKEFDQIAALAQRLGDKLPGSTADFYDMMTVLRKEGMSAQAVLGGLGEAAAYLGVQLQMPVTAAAAFAAKMQDATGATEAEMMQLMDVIQRTFYLGVDHTQMLSGFSKMTGVLGKVRKSGVEAVRELAPLIVMMNQDGMEDGGSAGNAIRKVIDAGLNAKRLAKANAAMKAAGAKGRLNFMSADGHFGGLPTVFEQLEQIKAIDNDMARTNVLRQLFGDDAETQQVLATLMKKGLAGYQEVVAKMEAQAALRERVDKQLDTLSNLWDAATGTFTNVMAGVGESIEDDVKRLIEWLGQITEKVGGWIKDNPALVRGIALTVAGFAALATVGGTAMLALAGIAGPLLMAQFMFSKLAIGTFGAKAAGWSLIPMLKAVTVGTWGLAKGGLLSLLGIFKALGTLMMVVGRATAAFLISPMGLALVAVAALAAGAYLLWKNWAAVSAWIATKWSWLVQAFIGIKNQMVTAGADLINGLISGITGRLAALKGTVLEAAASAANWFRQRLGINSPSRVFMTLGQNIPQGAALGIKRGVPTLRAAALAMATLPALNSPPMATAATIRPMESLASSVAAGAGTGTGTGSITQNNYITVNAAPGQDPRAVARAVGDELDRRERLMRSRVLSQLSDIDG